MLHRTNDYVPTTESNTNGSVNKNSKTLAITCINSITSQINGGGVEADKRETEADNIPVKVKSEALSADSTYDEDLLQSRKKQCTEQAQRSQEKYMSDFAEHFEINTKNGADLANSSEQLQSLLSMNFTVSDYISQQYLVRGSASYKVLKDKIREYCLSLKPSGMKDDTSTQVLFLVYKSLPDMMRTDEADSCIRKMIGKHIRNAKYRAKCKQKEYKISDIDRMYLLNGPRSMSSVISTTEPSMIPTTMMPKLHSTSKLDSAQLEDHLVHPQRPNFSSTPLQISEFNELLASSAMSQPLPSLTITVERSPDQVSPPEPVHTTMSSIYKPVQLLYQSPRQTLFSQNSRPHTEATSPLDMLSTLSSLKRTPEQPSFLPLGTLKSVSENLANSLQYNNNNSLNINNINNNTSTNVSTNTTNNTGVDKPIEETVINEVCDHKLKFISNTTYACVHCNDYFERLPRQVVVCMQCKKQFTHQHLLLQHTNEIHLGGN